MKILLVVKMALISMVSIAQIDYPELAKGSCEVMTGKAISVLEQTFIKGDFGSVEEMSKIWVQRCGVTELSQRSLIVSKMKEGESVEDMIQVYLENDLHHDLARRQYYSSFHNFGYIYSEDPFDFDYFPLRHNLDSLITNEVNSLLENGTLTDTEKLICLLYSEGFQSFEEEVEKRKYSRTAVRKYIYSSYREKGDYYMRYNVHSGVILPLKEGDVFGVNPYFGFTFSSPMEYRTVVDLGFKVRINANDRKFDYYANDKINQVDSKSNIHAGATVSYRVNNNERIKIYPKAGVGLEVINTGLCEKKIDEYGEEEKTSINLETVNLSAGISFLTPTFKTSYLGLGVSYHFCPYGLDKNLKTPIANNLVSSELFYRF